MVIERNLEAEMMADPDVISYCADYDMAKEFYSAMCNMRWKLIEKRPDDERIMDILRGEEPNIWSCTWRYAGGIIAEIRCQHYNTNEQYIDFYCSGNEGDVSEIVGDCFKRLGWEPYPWEDDGNI